MRPAAWPQQENAALAGLGSTMAKGAAWMLLARVATRVIGMLSTLVLARVLTPEDFGLVAMATSIVAVIELLRAFGFDTVLIQKQQAGRDHYDTAWTFNAIVGLVAAVVVLLLSIPATKFYGEARITPLMWLLAAGLAIQGFENVGIVDFRKYMRFDKDFAFVLGAKVAGFLVTVPAAVFFRSYWALVLGIMATRVWAVVASYAMHPYRPRFSLAAYRELISFSKWLLFNNILLYLKSRASDFVIGRVSGARSLGLFNVSYEIANLPTTEIVMPINRAVYSGYARMGNDRATLGQGFLNVISVITAFALPAGAGIAVLAPLLVPLALGDQWLEAMPIIQVLAIYGVLIALQTNTLYIYIALGEPRTATLLNALHVGILIPALIFGTMTAGAVGAAWACLITAVVNAPVNIIVLLNRLQLRPAELLAVAWRPLPAAILMFLAVDAFMIRAGSAEAGSVGPVELLAALFAGSVLGAFIYALSLWMLWRVTGRPPGIERELLSRLPSRWASWLGA